MSGLKNGHMRIGMNKSRREQINEAADNAWMSPDIKPSEPIHHDDYLMLFEKGAEWADANPIEPSVSANIRNEIIKRLEQKIKIAIEALEFYSRSSRNIQGFGMNPIDQIKIEIGIEQAHDDGKLARNALAKIEALK